MGANAAWRAVLLSIAMLLAGIVLLDCMGAVAKHVFLVTQPERLEATMRTAFELAPRLE